MLASESDYATVWQGLVPGAQGIFRAELLAASVAADIPHNRLWSRHHLPEHRILIRINILVSKNIDIDFVKNIDNINIQSIDFFWFFSSKNIDSNIVFFGKNIDLNIDLVGWLFGDNFNKKSMFLAAFGSQIKVAV